MSLSTFVTQLRESLIDCLFYINSIAQMLVDRWAESLSLARNPGIVCGGRSRARFPVLGIGLHLRIELGVFKQPESDYSVLDILR